MIQKSTFSNTAFSEFQIIHKQELKIFSDYRKLETFQIQEAHPLLRPFVKRRHRRNRAIENKLEIKNNLPEGYLAGLVHKTPSRKNYGRQAYAIAQEYFYAKLKWEVQNVLDQLLPIHTSLPEQVKEPDPIYQIMEARYTASPGFRGAKKLPPLSAFREEPVYNCSCKFRASAPSVNLLAEVNTFKLTDELKS